MLAFDNLKSILITASSVAIDYDWHDPINIVALKDINFFIATNQIEPKSIKLHW